MSGLSDQVEQLSADKARLEAQLAEQATANGLLTSELSKLRAEQEQAEALYASLARDMDALQVSAAGCSIVMALPHLAKLVIGALVISLPTPAASPSPTSSPIFTCAHAHVCPTQSTPIHIHTWLKLCTALPCHQGQKETLEGQLAASQVSSAQLHEQALQAQAQRQEALQKQHELAQQMAQLDGTRLRLQQELATLDATVVEMKVRTQLGCHLTCCAVQPTHGWMCPLAACGCHDLPCLQLPSVQHRSLRSAGKLVVLQGMC
jgi:hypothetical protein